MDVITKLSFHSQFKSFTTFAHDLNWKNKDTPSREIVNALNGEIQQIGNSIFNLLSIKLSDQNIHVIHARLSHHLCRLQTMVRAKGKTIEYHFEDCNDHYTDSFPNCSNILQLRTAFLQCLVQNPVSEIEGSHSHFHALYLISHFLRFLTPYYIPQSYLAKILQETPEYQETSLTKIRQVTLCRQLEDACTLNMTRFMEITSSIQIRIKEVQFRMFLCIQPLLCRMVKHHLSCVHVDKSIENIEILLLEILEDNYEPWSSIKVPDMFKNNMHLLGIHSDMVKRQNSRQNSTQVAESQTSKEDLDKAFKRWNGLDSGNDSETDSSPPKSPSGDSSITISDEEETEMGDSDQNKDENDILNTNEEEDELNRKAKNPPPRIRDMTPFPYEEKGTTSKRNNRMDM